MLVGALAACGGGGSDSTTNPSANASPAISVSFNVTSLNTGVLVTKSAAMPVSATLSSLPSGNVFVFIVADKPVIQTGATLVTQNADGSFSVTLETDPSLAVGTYSGTFTLELCKDALCASQYSLTGATLPYTIVVVPAVTLSVTSAGLPLSLDLFSNYDVHSGDTVTITSNIPVTWSQGSSSGSSTATATSTTTTSWTGTITGPFDGFVGVAARSIQAPQDNEAQALFDIDL
jgi:hypothetical protein